MNITLLDSWLREFVETDATPEEIKNYISLCGPSIERLIKVGSDMAYEIEITTNRVDMMCVAGITEEMIAILPRFGKKAKFTKKYQDLVNVSKKDISVVKKLPIEITDPENLCHRILGIVLDNITIKPSSKIIADRLKASGIRALNNVIDITNYVMTEVGHPCHVFDYDRIKTGKILIRKAKNGEKLVTLDDKEYTLTDQDVVIDNGTGRIIDLPGIMGTKNSVVTNDTKRVLLFIESNDPLVIRKTSMRLGIRTVAATINEKSPDPNSAEVAIVRGVKLLEDQAGANVASGLLDLYKNPIPAKPIAVAQSFIVKRLGVNLAAKEISAILSSMEFKVEKNEKLSETIFKITAPSWRQNDITIPEDIVEEVARIYGYHNLPNNLMTGPIPITQKPKDLYWEEKAKNILKYLGLTEIYSYSMVSFDLLKKCGLTAEGCLKIANPLTEELVYLRSAILPSMLLALAQNQGHKPSLALFELSKVYLTKKDDLPEELTKLAMGFWQKDYAEVKGILEVLLNELGIIDFEVRPSQNQRHKFFQNQKCGQIVVNNEKIGEIGIIKNEILDNFSLKPEIICTVFDFGNLVPLMTSLKKFHSLPLYPTAIENIALVLKPHTYLGDLIKAIKNVDEKISEVSLYDSYDNIRTLHIVYQNPLKTLLSFEIQQIRNKILKLAEEKFGARLKVLT